MKKKFYGIFLSAALVASSFSQGVLISSAEETENIEITTEADNVAETSEEAAIDASLEDETEAETSTSSEQVEDTADVAEESIALQDSEEINYVDLENVDVSFSTSDELAAGVITYKRFLNQLRNEQGLKAAA